MTKLKRVSTHADEEEEKRVCVKLAKKSHCYQQGVKKISFDDKNDLCIFNCYGNRVAN